MYISGIILKPDLVTLNQIFRHNDTQMCRTEIDLNILFSSEGLPTVNRIAEFWQGFRETFTF